MILEGNMKRQITGMLAGLIIGLGSASAADMNYQSEPDWTGGYIGGSIGVALAEFGYSNCCIGPDGWTAGPLLTVQLGHNWQNEAVSILKCNRQICDFGLIDFQGCPESEHFSWSIV